MPWSARSHQPLQGSTVCCMVSLVIYRLVFPTFEFYSPKWRVQAILAPTGWTVSNIRITQLPSPSTTSEMAPKMEEPLLSPFQPPAAGLIGRAGRAVQACLPRQDAHARLPPFIGRDSLGCQIERLPESELARAVRVAP